MSGNKLVILQSIDYATLNQGHTMCALGEGKQSIQGCKKINENKEVSVLFYLVINIQAMNLKHILLKGSNKFHDWEGKIALLTIL